MQHAASSCLSGQHDGKADSVIGGIRVKRLKELRRPCPGATKAQVVKCYRRLTPRRLTEALDLTGRKFAGVTQVGLQLGEELFDRIEVGRVRRQKQKLGATQVVAGDGWLDPAGLA
jgi:hypothetical protein